MKTKKDKFQWKVAFGEIMKFVTMHHYELIKIKIILFARVNNKKNLWGSCLKVLYKKKPLNALLIPTENHPCRRIPP